MPVWNCNGYVSHIIWINDILFISHSNFWRSVTPFYMLSDPSNTHGPPANSTHIATRRLRHAHTSVQTMRPPRHSETDMQVSQHSDQDKDDPIELFSDSVDNYSSDIESFHASELCGSDSDGEIIWTQAQIERQPPSSDNELVWPFPLSYPSHLFMYELGYQHY